MTICQMHDAANALLDALPLPAAAQAGRLAKAAWILQVTQAHNAAARAAHVTARRRQLRALGIHLDRLRCCIPTPSG